MKPSCKSSTHIWKSGSYRSSWLRLAGILAVSALGLLGSLPAPAATLYWDLNGTTANAGTSATGTWDGALVRWNDSLSGTGGTPTATTSNADDLIFSSGAGYTAGGTITLAGARVASSITFEENEVYTLSGGTSLTIGGTGASDGIFLLAAEDQAVGISTALILNGNNTIQTAGAGVLTISGGVTGTGNLILNNNSTNAAGITISTVSLNNTGTVTNSGSGSGGVTISSDIGTNVTGVTQNSATSSLTLSGVNTFTGGVTLTTGTLNINSTTALGATASTLTISGGTINNSSGGAITLANNNAQNWNANFTFTGSNALNLGTGAVTLSADRQVTVSASTLTVGGVIGGAFNLTKTGAGALTLSGTNTFGGASKSITLSAGTLNINNASALGDAANTFIISGGTIDNTSAGSITTSNHAQSWNGNFAFTGTQDLNLGTGNVTLGANRVVTVNGGNLTVGGVIDDGASSFTLTKAGVGTLTLSGANTYGGTTSVTGGVLLLNNATALPGGIDTTVGAGESALTINGGGVVGLGTGDFTRALGTGAGQVQWTGSGGFAAYNADRNVNLGGASAIVTWNSGSFVPTGSTLILGATDADATVTFQNPIALNGAVRTVQVNDGSAAVDAIFSGVLSGTGTSGLTKTGTGTATLSGPNTYAGVTTVSNGILNIQNSTALGTTAGDTSVAAAGELQLQGGIVVAAGETLSLTAGATLRNISGSNTWTDTITLANVTGATNIISDSGTLTLGAIDETGANNKGLTFDGAGNVIIGGTLTSGGSQMPLIKNGTGTVTLSGASNAYGGTTTVNRGTLTLDYTGSNTTKLADGDALILGGGTVNLSGGTHTEVVASTTIAEGASSITRAGGSTATLQMNAITRNAGGTINFGAASIATTDTTNTNGILGAWATINGTDFAINSTNGLNGPITALATFTDVIRLTTGGSKVIADGAATNVRIIEGSGAAADITLGAATTTINTLTQNAAGGTLTTIDFASQTLRLGGVLVSAGAGALRLSDGGGTLTTNDATSGELVLQNFSTGALTVNAVIANNTTASDLAIAGTGSVIVNETNTYTGKTTVNGGTLEVGSGSFGSLSGTTAMTVNNGGTLFLNGTGGQNQVNDSANFTLDGGTIQLGAGAAINETVGTLSLSSSSIIDFSTFNNTSLNFANSSGASWLAGSTLNIYNWTKGSDHLFFGSTSAGLTLAQLGQITLYSDSGSNTLGPAVITSSGEVVAAVPEPSAVLVGLCLLSLAGYRERRWLLRCKAAGRNPAIH